MFQYYISNSVDSRVADLRAAHGSSLFLKAAVPDLERENAVVQQDWATGAVKHAHLAAKAKAAEESIDDEDDICRALLAPRDYARVQRILLRGAQEEGERGRKRDALEAELSEGEEGVARGRKGMRGGRGR